MKLVTCIDGYQAQNFIVPIARIYTEITENQLYMGQNEGVGLRFSFYLTLKILYVCPSYF